MKIKLKDNLVLKIPLQLNQVNMKKIINNNPNKDPKDQNIVLKSLSIEPK